MRTEVCAACGRLIEGPERGQVWRGGRTASYHLYCYEISSWEGFPELDNPEREQ